jgi:hypothetical protein
MRSKQDLLDRMGALKACLPAFDWVHTQEGSAEEILLRLDRVDWLCWLLGRVDPESAALFAEGCADRAKGYDGHYAARYAADARAAARYAADARYTSRAVAAANAADYARAAAAVTTAAGEREELKTQLAELHELAKKVCA